MLQGTAMLGAVVGVVDLLRGDATVVHAGRIDQSPRSMVKGSLPAQVESSLGCNEREACFMTPPGALRSGSVTLSHCGYRSK